MILLLTCVGTLLAAIFVGLYHKPWPFVLLGIWHRQAEDVPGLRRLTAYHDPPQVAAPLPPTLDYVHEATGRVDFRSFESVTQALRVVHSAKEAIPVESLTIIVPLLLSLVLTGWWWYKRRQSSSTTSADSRTSCRSNSSLHTLQESDEAKHRRPGGPTLRSYRLGRRRHSVPIPSVQFPALANFGPAESTGTDDSASVPVLRQRSPLTGFLTASEEQLFPLSVSSDTDQPLNVGGRLKRWLRDAVWPDLLGYNPTICGGVLEDFSAAEYHGGTLRTEELAPRPQTSSYGGCTRDDVNRADDANRASTEAFETPLLDDIYCRRSDASEDGTDETEVVEGNWADLDESRPQRLEWQPSHHHQRDERRRSGLADWELSHVNNSGLSEDTAYLALPENKCPSEEVLGACSFDQHQQNACCAAAAAVAPCFVSPVEPLRAPRHSQDLFEQLLKACRQPEAVAFSEILQELGVETCVKLHESEHTDIFRVSGVRCAPMVLKVFDCSYIARHVRCLCNEINTSW
ncbi:uncharacterized protein LOC144125153 [Amblyomma americanum]